MAKLNTRVQKKGKAIQYNELNKLRIQNIKQNNLFIRITDGASTWGPIISAVLLMIPTGATQLLGYGILVGSQMANIANSWTDYTLEQTTPQQMNDDSVILNSLGASTQSIGQEYPVSGAVTAQPLSQEGIINALQSAWTKRQQNVGALTSAANLNSFYINIKSISNEIPRKPDHKTINIFSPTNRVAFSITLSLNTNLNLPLPEKLI